MSVIYVLVADLYLLSSALCVFGAAKARSIPIKDMRNGLMALFACAASWALLDGAFLLASSRETKSTLFIIALSSGFATVWAWLYFASAFAGRTAHGSDIVWGIGIVFFLFVVALKATNPLHGLYFELVTHTQPFPHVGVEPGLLYLASKTVAYLLALVGYSFLIRTFRQTAGSRRLAFLFGVMLLPLAANVAVYVSPALPRLNYDSIGVALFAGGVYSLFSSRISSMQRVRMQDNPAFSITSDGVMAGCNTAFLRLLPEASQQQAIGAPLRDLAPPLAEAVQNQRSRVELSSPRPSPSAAEGTAFRPGEPAASRQREQVRRSNRTFRITTSRFGQQPARTVITLTDITEQARREQRTHDQFLGLTESLPGVVFQFAVHSDGSYSMPYISRNAEEVLHIPASTDPEEIFPALLARVPDPFHASLLRSIQIAVERRAQWRSEIPFVLGDDTQRWLLGSSTPKEDGDRLLFNGVLLDITRQKETERELLKERNEVQAAQRQAQEARREAEQANRMKSAMLANMSHEVRTPLTSILGFAEVLSTEAEGDARRFARLIHKSAMSLENTLTAVLTLSELEATPTDLNRELVDLKSVLNRHLRRVGPEAREANLTLSANRASVYVRTSQTAVDIILQNLIGNAVKYTPPGGHIRVWAIKDGDRAGFQVSDTGCGMDPDAIGDLIEPFRQASEGYAREYEGVGLGLTLVQRTAKTLGASIEFSTAPGKGTTVTVWLRGADGPTITASKKEHPVDSA